MVNDFQEFMSNKKDEHLFDGLFPVDDVSLSAITNVQTKVPVDYIGFLKEYGCGEIEVAGLMLYNGFLEVGEVFDAETAVSLSDILIFGDDMQGRCIGFDKNDHWAVVEIGSSDISCRKLSNTFSEFLYDRLS
ncbi:SMI1/KNR4 family protein [Pseudomonas kilonensis]|uniref:Knr4/Smi1-like domain-containing protein n=1 Tax=Pseudomonas kilonensis TaxID=132476 RepID=A0ABY0Z058_9PSED|nr:SMI1/KNR4 family protein [Pseudomonas kilonensis]SEE15111.1 hypothetical protein SAMN04490188_2786 [Pseudomonas kilonensis]